jgi:hypothetical protein
MWWGEEIWSAGWFVMVIVIKNELHESEEEGGEVI